MLSLDRAILERDSAVQKRLLALADRVPPKPLAEGEEAGEITVFVPAGKDEKLELSPSLTVYAFGGLKIVQMWKIWREGKRLLATTAPSLLPLQGEHHHLASQTRHSSSTEEERGREKGERFDLITVQDAYFLGFLAVQLGKKFSVPVEVQIHGFEKRVGARARLARFVLSGATKIRVVSERLRHFLNSEFRIQNSAIYRLPVYTQVEVPERLGKRKTVPYPFTFLTVGRLVPVKNIGLQIRAFAKLAKQIPHIRLRIVGEGPDLEKLKSEALSSKLEEKIVFEGGQKEVGKYYEEADAFLLTSDYEGWGRVVLEASAYRLPIIMTDVGLAREVIVNEESGLIIPVGDEEELVRAMKDLLDKPELRERLGEGAERAFRALPMPEEQIQKQVTEWQVLINRK